MESISELHGTADQLRELFHSTVVEDVKLLQSALMLYRQGMVSQVKIEGTVVKARVQDVSPVNVGLDVLFPISSECSCPADGVCRHIMAVFFNVYSQVGSISDWMEEWREPAREQVAVTKWGLSRAKDLVKANGVMKPDYDQWIQSFDESFDSLLRSKKFSSPYVVAELFEIYLRRIQAAAPRKQEWRLLYELVAHVFSFQKLAVLSEELGHSEEVIKRSYRHLFHQMLDQAEDLVFKISVQTMPFSFDEFIERFKDDVTGLLTCTQAMEYERIYLYRHLWAQVFKKREWREEEIKRVSDRLRTLSESENGIPLAIAEIHLNVLVGNDGLGLELMSRMEDADISPFMLYWIDLLSGQKAWKRVGPMIELFLQKIKKYLEFLGSYNACSSFTRIALKSIRPYCVESGRADLYERALLQALPYSFHEYEHLLFERSQYERWGELHSFIGFHYADLPSSRVKIVEKEMPEVLLPLLHQSALREINLKNRTSYRQAVRYLKKLRTLYKKRKRLDEWQFFFDTLMDKTKRLRAFHEECKRSKLIDA